MKTARTTLVKGLIYFVLLLTILCIFLWSNLKKECSNDPGWGCIGVTLGSFLIFVLLSFLYWFFYGFRMNSECPGSGYFMWIFLIIIIIHYYVSINIIVKTAERKFYESIENTPREPSDGKVKEDKPLQDTPQSLDLKKAYKIFNYQFLFSVILYIILLFVSLGYYKCPSDTNYNN